MRLADHPAHNFPGGVCRLDRLRGDLTVPGAQHGVHPVQDRRRRCRKERYRQPPGHETQENSAFVQAIYPEAYLPTASRGPMVGLYERLSPRSTGSEKDWQHACVWCAHSARILPTMPSREDSQRRQMAGPNAGADSWIVRGMCELWCGWSRRPAELGRAEFD
jgi:hypothetical protein